MSPERERLEIAMCTLLLWPAMTTARLRVLCSAVGAEESLRALASRADLVGETLVEMPGAASSLFAQVPDLGALHSRAMARWCTGRAGGMSMWLPGDPWWEDRFANHSQQPAALFTRGDRALLERPRVAIVGTRSATPPGREMARLLGHELSDAGVAVVSGLAFGIDAHAHAGALASRDPAPIAVVGSGLDVIYPRQNSELWGRVGSQGLLVSEYLPSTRPSTHSFPARNRIIAALSQVVVVVESTDHGGSLLTADEAHRWKRPVMVVPGNPLHPSCVGSNQLLRQRLGERPVQVCLETADVLSLLMLDRAVDSGFTDQRRSPDEPGEAVLGALGWETLSTGRLVSLTGRAPAEVAAALDQLDVDGWVECHNGAWSQRASAIRAKARKPATSGEWRKQPQLFREPSAS